MKINIKKSIIIILFIIILVSINSCMMQTEPRPSSVTLQPTNTDLHTTTIPTIAPTPNLLPEGLIYKIDDEYWKLDSTQFFIGTRNDLLQNCQNLVGFLKTKQYCLEDYAQKAKEEGTPIWLDSVIKLENDAEYALWSAIAWEDNPGYYLLEVQPGKEPYGPGYQTMPASIKYDGTEFTLIGQTPESTGPHSLSNDGQTLAFEERGVPWIYHPGQKAKQLIPAEYGFPTLEGSHFSFPSFSSNDQTLVWSVYGYKDGTPIEGIAIFNLVNQTSEFIKPISISCPDVSCGIRDWSPNNQYFILVNDLYGLIYVLDIYGNIIDQFPFTHSMVWFTWNPSSNAVIMTFTNWNDLYENYLFYIDTQVFVKLMLPEKAVVVDWID